MNNFYGLNQSVITLNQAINSIGKTQQDIYARLLQVESKTNSDFASTSAFLPTPPIDITALTKSIENSIMVKVTKNVEDAIATKLTKAVNDAVVKAVADNVTKAIANTVTVTSNNDDVSQLQNIIGNMQIELESIKKRLPTIDSEEIDISKEFDVAVSIESAVKGTVASTIIPLTTAAVAATLVVEDDDITFGIKPPARKRAVKK